MDPRCLMCSPDFEEESSDLTYLRLHKPTENRGWVHILCAVFCSEIQFANTSRLRLVEGLSCVPDWKRTSICVLCRKKGGVTLKCADTSEAVHVSCAALAGFAVGFEIQAGKAKKDGVIVTFKSETGTLTPVVARKPRRLYGLCDVDSNGQTAVELYCSRYKQAPLDHSYGLLRKAKRMDTFLLLPDRDSLTTKVQPLQCSMSRRSIRHSSDTWTAPRMSSATSVTFKGRGPVYPKGCNEFTVSLLPLRRCIAVLHFIQCTISWVSTGGC